MQDSVKPKSFGYIIKYSWGPSLVQPTFALATAAPDLGQILVQILLHLWNTELRSVPSMESLLKLDPLIPLRDSNS